MSYRDEIAQAVAAAAQLPAAEVAAMLETPPSQEMGDFALPCFKLAKTLRKAPPMIADMLKESVTLPPAVERVESVKGYLNFYLHRAQQVRDALAPVRALGEAYGHSQEGQGRTVCIDYSSINIAKRFHIGHLSTTVLGHALARIYTAMGYKVVSINHLGDWGTQFGKMICAYKKWGNRQMIEEGGIQAMTELYVRFDQEAQKDETLLDEGRAWFKRIEDQDPEAMEIFTWFKEITLKDAMRVYDMLGITFDSYAGESFYNDKMGRVIDELTAKGLLRDSDGAKVVDVGEDMPPCLILKKDGATLYATRDLAAALYRKDTYDFAKCLYVVAYQQNLHFRQLFKVIELMGYPWYKDMEHISYGMVSYEGQTLATRKGHVVYLDDLLARAVEKAAAIIQEKNPDLPNKEQVARQVGIGSVVFTTLFNSRIKDIDFWWDRALNFDGETAPYVQYCHARCCSLLRKAGGAPAGEVDYSLLDDESSLAVAKLIASFPETVADACHRGEPFLITRLSVALAQAFNRFYLDNRILVEDPAVTAARLALTDAVRQVLRNALYLLGVEAPEAM